MPLTDTHCHLDFNKFDADRPEVIERAKQAGLTRILIPSLTLESSRAALALAQTDPILFAAVGVHPNDALTWNPSILAELRALCLGNRLKIVAIGEIGLDYYWKAAPIETQKDILRQQLALAGELGLPVVLHLREKDDAIEGDCARDMLEILTDWVGELRQAQSPLCERPGVLHSFSGSLATAQAALALNFYIGITGPITYKNAETRRELASQLPLERVLIETDAPFLAPLPYRGKRNEPAFVRYIADKIAEIHPKNPEEIANQTTVNAARLFAWGG